MLGGCFLRSREDHTAIDARAVVCILEYCEVSETHVFSSLVVLIYDC